MEVKRAWIRAAQGVWVSALLLAGAQGAAAEECADDDDCGTGFVCEAQGRGCPEIAIDCDDQNDCPTPPECNAEPVHVCVPGPCSTDDDCGDGMVCYTQSFQRCEGGASRGCPPGEACDPAPPVEPTCTTETISQCVPRWVPPCEEDSDCGPGFRCVEQIERGCSGSAGRPLPDDGDEPAPPPTEPMCFENPTGRFGCELIETACSDDDDCEAGLTCESNPSYPVCSSAGPADGAGDSAGAADRACPEPTAPRQVCLPPNYASDLGGGRAEAGRGQSTSAPNSADDAAGDPNQEGAGESAPPRVVSHGCSAAGSAAGGHWLALVGWLLIAAAPIRRRKR